MSVARGLVSGQGHLGHDTALPSVLHLEVL